MSAGGRWLEGGSPLFSVMDVAGLGHLLGTIGTAFKTPETKYPSPCGPGKDGIGTVGH